MNGREDRPSRKAALLLLVGAFIVLAPFGASGGKAPVCVLGQEEAYDLRPFMDHFEDREGRLSIDEVASPAMADRFGPPPKGHFNFGFTSSTLWFRFTIAERPSNTNGGRQPELWILDPGWHLYDTIHLYVPNPEAESGWHVYAAGRLLSAPGGQEKRHFQLPPDLDVPTTCYIRVTGIRPLMVAPTVATLDRTLRINGFKTLGFGLLIGFFVTLMIGNLAIYLYTGNSKYKWFVLSNLTFVSFVGTASYQHFLVVKNLPTIIMSVGLVGQAIVATTVRMFFELRRHNRTLNTILLVGVWAVLGVAASAFVLPEEIHPKLSIYAVLPLSVVVFWACFDCIKRDRVPALIFMAAWLGAFLSALSYNWAVKGGLPFVHPIYMWASFVGEAVCMSILLAHNIERISVQRQAAEAMAKARSSFLAGMSHEIRTPMTAVLGFLTLSQKLGAQGQLRHYLLKVKAAAGHLLDIINDILDLAKIEADKVELEARPFVVESLLHDAADILASRAFESGNELVVSVQPGLPGMVTGDALRLKQVILNLGSNAVKFTRGGTVRLAVSKAEDALQRQDLVMLRFEVSDTGIGIDPAVLPRLFQSFEQADAATARVYGGTGLGLSISRRLVQLMGGEIGVQSRPGKGSIFRFTVALGACPEGVSPGRFLAPEALSLNVLIVEDNPASRRAMEEVLHGFGIRHMTACSITEASQFAASQSFDLVLLDWDLPEGTAPQTVALLRSASRLEGVPVALMTSPVRPELENLPLERFGAQAVLAKPFTPTSVADVLTQAVASGASASGDDAGSASDAERDMELARGLRVLLAEDNLFNQELMQVILAEAGVEMEAVADGREAVLRVTEEDIPPDLVLMDVHMPVMDGFDAARAIRADQRFGGLPIIAMTADTAAEDKARCLEAGMNDHLAKPVDTGELFRILVRWGRQPRGAA
jgi:two-component system, sensor histidine kinase and response regulator